MAVKNPVTVSEILKTLPGVSLQEAGTIGESAVLSLRGTESNQTLLMLDGVRLNSPLGGGTDLGDFLMDEIGQIEVVRGGQSALFGSDAMGGVVNLRLKRGSGPPKTALSFGAGNGHLFREGLASDGTLGRVDYSTSLSRVDFEGQGERDAFESTSFSGLVGLPFKGSGRIEYSTRVQRSGKELATDIIQTTVPVQIVSDENNDIRKRFDFHSVRFEARLNQWLDLSWKTALLDTTVDWKNPEDPFVPGSNDYFERSRTRYLVADFQQDLHWSSYDTVTFGIERTRDSVDSRIRFFGSLFPIKEGRDNTAYYLQNMLRWEKRLVFQAGIRMDVNSKFQSVYNPKFSIAYAFPSTGTRVRGNWGTGFRAPSIQDLFSPLGGNTELNPERSRNWEAGIRQEIGESGSFIDLAFFRMEFTDLIQRTPGGIENVGTARNQGLETLFEVRLGAPLTFKTNYTYLETRNGETGQRLPFRPRHQANVGFLFSPRPDMTADVNVLMVSNQALDEDFILKDGSLLVGESPGYSKLDLAVSYHRFNLQPFNKEGKFYVKVLNLFNRTYQEVPGFDAPGVSFLAGMVFNL